jgi:hypothetical protein
MDATSPPPNRRPSAEQIAARLAEIDKHYRKQRQKKRFHRAPMRFTDLQKLMCFRYNDVMPEGDDGALDDLSILLTYTLMSGKPPWPRAMSVLCQQRKSHVRPVRHVQRRVPRRIPC